MSCIIMSPYQMKLSSGTQTSIRNTFTQLVHGFLNALNLDCFLDTRRNVLLVFYLLLCVDY